jgi:TetR/AcrR family transcriptional regulator, cholesterol catabolism regulator
MSAMPRSAGLDPTSRPPDPDALPPTQRARRDRIVRAAVELLDASEYESVQMRDVAERADVALGTLYRYFSSKEHLYAAVLVAWAAEYGRPTRAAPGGDGGDEARLRALLRRAVRAFERAPQMVRVHWVIDSSSDPNATALFQAFATTNTDALSDALRDLDPPTRHAVVHAVQAVLSQWLRSWALGRCTIREVDTVVQETVGLIFSGPPGRTRGP